MLEPYSGVVQRISVPLHLLFRRFLYLEYQLLQTTTMMTMNQWSFINECVTHRTCQYLVRYHMRGLAVGSLRIYSKPLHQKSLSSPIWSRSASQSPKWIFGQVKKNRLNVVNVRWSFAGKRRNKGFIIRIDKRTIWVGSPPLHPVQNSNNGRKSGWEISNWP